MNTVSVRIAFAAGFLLAMAACGGGGSDSSVPPGGGPPLPANTAPIANAGAEQSVRSGAQVTLNGSASSDLDGTIASYTWTQVSGPAVSLTNAAGAQPSFTAPTVSIAVILTFSLVVTDNRGTPSVASRVDVVVNPLNSPPSASTGAPLTVTGIVTVTLSGSGIDTDGTIAGFAWSQTAGPAVTLLNANTATPQFVTPAVSITTALTFSLVVTDDRGATSLPANVTITVNPPAASVTIGGTLRFTRVPFLAGSPYTLDYANPVLQPARRVRIRIMDAGTQAVLSSDNTSATGAYSLTAPANTSVFIQVVAWMDTDPARPLLGYDVRVQDGTTGSTGVYTYNSAVFNSSTPFAQFDIPSGLSATGTQVGTRASAPFAILDTIYKAIQFVGTVAPNATLPQLYVDWGTQKGGTFFSTTNGAHIALQADLTEDTDEFDEHVVAHEFGHYVERSFSRSDSIGGSHALGNRLDPRVAWGEGWATAFGAMALGDPFYRDSFFRSGSPAVGGWVIERSPTTPATAPDSTGCWCSESSVAAILWDLYDAPADANDALALGIQPLWSVLTGAQRTTPAVTSIFSFIDGLKTARPANAAAIDQLVVAQNIDASLINPFATSETHTPIAGTLPIFTDISLGTPVVVHTFDDGGHYNRLGNRRLLRFVPASSGSVTIRLTTSNTDVNSDPDFVVYSSGTRVATATSAPPQAAETTSLNVTAGNTYIIDAYDCANGCSAVEGTPGDYDLTVTIN